MKKCTKCGVEKEEGEFCKHKKSSDGLKCWCKECGNSYNKEFYSDLKNKNRKKEAGFEYRNRPEIKIRLGEYEKKRSHDPERKKKTSNYNTKYNSKPEIKEKRRNYAKSREKIPEVKSRRAAREKIKGKEYRKRPEVKKRTEVYGHAYMAPYRRNRRKRDPLFKLICNLRARVRSAIKCGGYSKKSKTCQLLGADFETVKTHLENTWFQNYGTPYSGQEVHIDHIIPCSAAKTEEELIALQHYTNLQYLTPEDNLSKHDKVPGQEIVEKFFLTRLGAKGSLNDGEANPLNSPQRL